MLIVFRAFSNFLVLGEGNKFHANMIKNVGQWMSRLLDLYTEYFNSVLS